MNLTFEIQQYIVLKIYLARIKKKSPNTFNDLFILLLSTGRIAHSSKMAFTIIGSSKRQAPNEGDGKTS